MLSTVSSNVVLSKARAMFGKRLTDEDYDELLNCRTVADAASYLKSNTAYGTVLAGVNESDIHRGQLETLLRRKFITDSAALARYEITVGEYFSNYFIRRLEVGEILHAILLMEEGSSDEYVFYMPAYLTHHTHINLKLLSKLKNYDDLLAALSHTPYYAILKPFRPENGGQIEYSKIENSLYGYIYSRFFSIINKHTKGETKKQLLDIFNLFIDLINYSHIVRLKTAYATPPDAIKGYIFPYGTVKKRCINEMAEAETEPEVRRVMSGTLVGKRVLKTNYLDASEVAHRMNFKTCRHYIRFSTHPSVVMVSYMLLLEAEIRDIITIVEGIRYKLPPGEIRKMLVIVNYREGSD
jgi:V/A-type H+-transporting ATPase subunit C